MSKVKVNLTEFRRKLKYFLTAIKNGNEVSIFDGRNSKLIVTLVKAD